METPRIIEMRAEDALRLKAVCIRPDPNGGLIVVGGDNAQGKTSVLDSIEIALRGASAMPSEPIRRGAKRAKINLDLGDLLVERTITPGGHRLVVRNKDGVEFASPQKLLDELVGRLTFDPLAFTRMKEAEQLETLKKLAGLDFTSLDAQRLVKYNERTEINKKLLGAQSALKGLSPTGVDTPIDTAPLMQRLKEASRINEAGNEKIKAVEDARNEYRKLGERIIELQAEIAKLKAQQAEITAAAPQLKAAAEAVQLVDVAATTAELEQAQETNRLYNLQVEYLAAAKMVSATQDISERLTQEIKDIDDTKQKLVEKANLPLPGLSVSDKEVIFNGIPLKQASSAEQLRISAAMGMALNPKLKVMLIRDGSLLDPNSLQMLEQLCAANGYQIWLERVSKGAECSVIIEDGSIQCVSSSPSISPQPSQPASQPAEVAARS